MLIVGNEDKFQDIIILWRGTSFDKAAYRIKKLNRVELMFLCVRSCTYAQPLLMARELVDFQDFVLRAVEDHARR